jgi:hypothetical protein
MSSVRMGGGVCDRIVAIRISEQNFRSFLVILSRDRDCCHSNQDAVTLWSNSDVVVRNTDRCCVSCQRYSHTA